MLEPLLSSMREQESGAESGRGDTSTMDRVVAEEGFGKVENLARILTFFYMNVGMLAFAGLTCSFRIPSFSFLPSLFLLCCS